MSEATNPWTPEKKHHWFLKQTQLRSYADDVVARLSALTKDNTRSALTIEQYGRLTVDPKTYPLYIVRIGDRQMDKPNILITGGVHGYETSGVKGALQFIEQHALDYVDDFNFTIAPCISPWSYETINRLNPIMENPNREFRANGKAEESQLLMDYLYSQNLQFDGHLDLHETTDSDRVFLPEEYAKNGFMMQADEVHIPDGYYLIGVKGYVRKELEKTIIDHVRQVTHIAQADSDNCLIGTTLSSEGVVHCNIAGLCAQYTTAATRFGSYTTEMYPDSPRFKSLTKNDIEAICLQAQVASILAALDFWKLKSSGTII